MATKKMANKGLEKFEIKDVASMASDWKVWRATFVVYCKTAGLKFDQDEDEEVIKKLRKV